PGLIQLLQDPEWNVRDSAADALDQIGDKSAIPGLIQLLEHPESNVRERAADALGKIGDKSAIPGLIQLLEHPESNVRERAADALGKIGDKSAIPGLIQLLEHPESNVRERAADALRKIGDKSAIPGLIQLLEDPDRDVRYRAAYVLGQVGHQSAIPGLIQFLEDPDRNVRYSAAYVLGKVGHQSAIPLLIKALSNANSVIVKNLSDCYIAIETLEKVQEIYKFYQIPPTPMSNFISHNYALLIAVNESAYPNRSLPVTVKDIQALKSILVNSNLCGYLNDNDHLRLLFGQEATKQKILDGLNWLKQQAENDPEATILIYYSGHGYLHEYTDEYYLIPYDTTVSITKSALPAKTFKEALQQITSKRLLVIIDSCHAAGMATSKDEEPEIPDGFLHNALPDKYIAELEQGAGRAVFTSSTGKQKSWVRRDQQMSIYTYHLLEALQGAGNQPGDTMVHVSDLMRYLRTTVSQSTQQEYKKEQTPYFDFACEDFPVALLRAGKGLPEQGWEQVKSEAQEKINSITTQLTNTGNITGDSNTNITIGHAGNISFGNISPTHNK
nr:HEAT repeat domain-containing protein [Aetokthonos hydrillicola CCALA 1050]